MAAVDETPNVAEILGPILARVDSDKRPLLMAIAERLAAERYRAWAREPEVASHEAELMACAEREEEIASRVEALHSDAEAIQRDILAKHPDLTEINRSLFAGRPVHQQFEIQAEGERLGAATWKALAGQETRSDVREALLACAGLEEESAVVLESILGARS